MSLYVLKDTFIAQTLASCEQAFTLVHPDHVPSDCQYLILEDNGASHDLSDPIEWLKTQRFLGRHFAALICGWHEKEKMHQAFPFLTQPDLQTRYLYPSDNINAELNTMAPLTAPALRYFVSSYCDRNAYWQEWLHDWRYAWENLDSSRLPKFYAGFEASLQWGSAELKQAWQNHQSQLQATADPALALSALSELQDLLADQKTLSAVLTAEHQHLTPHPDFLQILIINDQDQSRLTDQLAGLGYQLKQCDTHQAALQELKQKTCQVILLDWYFGHSTSQELAETALSLGYLVIIHSRASLKASEIPAGALSACGNQATNHQYIHGLIQKAFSVHSRSAPVLADTQQILAKQAYHDLAHFCEIWQALCKDHEELQHLLADVRIPDAKNTDSLVTQIQTELRAVKNPAIYQEGLKLKALLPLIERCRKRSESDHEGSLFMILHSTVQQRLDFFSCSWLEQILYNLNLFFSQIDVSEFLLKAKQNTFCLSDVQQMLDRLAPILPTIEVSSQQRVTRSTKASAKSHHLYWIIENDESWQKQLEKLIIQNHQTLYPDQPCRVECFSHWSSELDQAIQTYLAQRKNPRILDKPQLLAFCDLGLPDQYTKAPYPLTQISRQYGLKLLQHLRAAERNIPCVVITTLSNIYNDYLCTLSQGVSQYLLKRNDMLAPDLRAAMQVIFSKQHTLYLDEDNKIAYLNQHIPLQLGPKAYHLLTSLAQCASPANTYTSGPEVSRNTLTDLYYRTQPPAPMEPALLEARTKNVFCTLNLMLQKEKKKIKETDKPVFEALVNHWYIRYQQERHPLVLLREMLNKSESDPICQAFLLILAIYKDDWGSDENQVAVRLNEFLLGEQLSSKTKIQKSSHAIEQLIADIRQKVAAQSAAHSGEPLEHQALIEANLSTEPVTYRLRAAIHNRPASPVKKTTPWRLLVLEDDQITQGQLVQIYQQAGFQVKTCSNFQAALQTYTTFRPHLISLDLHFPAQPDTDPLIFAGIHYLKYIRQQNHDVKVLIPSTYADQNELIRLAQDLGVRADYLVPKSEDFQSWRGHVLYTLMRLKNELELGISSPIPASTDNIYAIEWFTSLGNKLHLRLKGEQICIQGTWQQSVLTYLFRNPLTFVPAESFNIPSRQLSSTINKLNQAFKKSNLPENLILSQKIADKAGYILNAVVIQISEEETA